VLLEEPDRVIPNRALRASSFPGDAVYVLAEDPGYRRTGAGSATSVPI
jgi:hypothetical protein